MRKGGGLVGCSLSEIRVEGTCLALGGGGFMPDRSMLLHVQGMNGHRIIIGRGA